MKSSRTETRRSFHKIPEIEFTDRDCLSSYGGLVVFQALFRVLRLRRRLHDALRHLGPHVVYGPESIVMLLVVHIALGFRRLAGIEYYHDDPLVKRVLGLRVLPSLSTLSRALRRFDGLAISRLRGLVRSLVLMRIKESSLGRITLDFDGSVQSTKGHAEGTAVGFNKVKKGARSYYPLFCTVAQTGQFYDLRHRPGNVHDSNGAGVFMAECFTSALQELGDVRLESRMDAAFYSEEIFDTLTSGRVEFSCSVPFQRFPELKTWIEERRRWTTIDDDTSYFEREHKSKSWRRKYRFIFVRTKRAVPIKGPLQLDLFEPRDAEFEYKVLATNKTGAAEKVITFHDGRGSQERIFGEAKQFAALDVLASRTLVGNQLFTICSMLAHNLGRELQMVGAPPAPSTEAGNNARWGFLELGSLRQRFLHRAAAILHPGGRMTLRMSANRKVAAEMTEMLDRLAQGRSKVAA